MNGTADVHSLQALVDWHAALCIFRTEAMESLASISLEIQRADAWLDDKLRFWQRESRDAEEDVVRCKAELFNRKFPDFAGRIPDCSVQEENLWRAEGRLERALDQVELVRRWYQKLPKMINEEYEGQARHLGNLLEAELPRGLAMLKHQIASIEAYLNLKVESLPPRPATPPTTQQPTATERS